MSAKGSVIRDERRVESKNLLDKRQQQAQSGAAKLSLMPLPLNEVAGR